jgi:hypothetical protein
MKKILFLVLVAVLATTSPVWGQTFGGGDGTETNPYLISNADHWLTLVGQVNHGTSYSGKFFKQTANISITSCVGDADTNAFSGTFDGNGYTIDITFENAQLLYVAPFSYIDGATIRGVHLVGTLSSTSPYAGCIVGYAKGTSTVTNCINSANITNKYILGNAYDGGIVGMVSTNGSIINITNCLFNGTMSDEGSASNYENWTGILGLCDFYCTANISNCLVAPVNTVNNGKLFYHGHGGAEIHLFNNYYTKFIGYNAAYNTQGGIDGSSMTAAQLADSLGDGWHVDNGKAVPYVVPFTLSQIPDGWTVTVNGVPVTVTNDTIVICAGNEVVFTPTDVIRLKSVTIKNASSTEPTINVSPTKQTDGTWKFTMPAANSQVVVKYGLMLTVGTNDPALGTVEVSAEGLIDNQNGSYTVDTGTVMTVKAKPTEHYHIVNWTNENNVVIGVDTIKTFTVTGDTTLTANFAIDVFEVFVEQTAHGTVMYNGATGSNHYWFSYNTEMSLTAIADENYHFVKWNDDNSTENPRTVSIIQKSDFSATFAINTSRLDSVNTSWDIYIDGAQNPIHATAYSNTDSMGYVMIPVNANVVITPQPVPHAVKVDKLEVINKPVNLANIKSDSTVHDGDVLTGTLNHRGKISIADGATVMLDNVTVENTIFVKVGLNCLGDATIILKDGTTNTIAGSTKKAGIYVPAGHTLTICGTGTLNATGNGGAAGIGAGSSNSEPGGHIIITGGTITATGDENAAGIGGGEGGNIGDITITGGNITATGGINAAGIGGGWKRKNGNITITGGDITATGGEDAPAIGAGVSGSGGNITITNAVAKVTAYKGSGNYQDDYDCIGKSYSGSCGTVTIGGTMYYNGSQYQNNGYSYLRQNNTFIYHPQH